MLLSGVAKHRERHRSVSAGTDALAMEAVPEQKNHTTLLGCVNVQCLISAKCSYPKKVSFTAVMNVKQSTVAVYHRLAG